MGMICVNCGHELQENRCKVRCSRCGYFEDCSDPAAPGDWTPPERTDVSAGRNAPEVKS